MIAFAREEGGLWLTLITPELSAWRNATLATNTKTIEWPNKPLWRFSQS